MNTGKYISILFLAFICLNLKSQINFLPGYIVTNDNDTIKGLIDYRGDLRNSKVCSFKTNDNSATISYEPFAIKAYRFTDDKYYVSKSVPDGKNQYINLFVELLVDGISDLYYYRDNSKSDHYLISKSDGELIELNNKEVETTIDGKVYLKKSNRYIGILKYSFSDCFEIQKEIDKAELNHKSLISISKDYHNFVCKDQQCLVYKKQLPLFKVQFSPFVGMNISSISFNGDGLFSTIKFKESFSPALGLKMSTSLPRLNEKISFQISALLHKNYFYGYNESSSFNPHEYQDIHIHSANLDLIASLKYTYPKGKIRPTIFMGGGQSFAKNIDSRRVYEVQFPNSVYTYELKDIPLPGKYGIVNTGIGCNLHLTNGIILFIDTSYSFRQGYFNGVKSDSETYGINTGILF